jgi:hypothetical protein
VLTFHGHEGACLSFAYYMAGCYTGNRFLAYRLRMNDSTTHTLYEQNTLDINRWLLVDVDIPLEWKQETKASGLSEITL